MIKKKICAMLAALMVATTVLGGQGISVSASTTIEVDSVTRATATTPEESEGLEDGVYKITNDAFKVDTTENSGIRDYIDTKSTVTVKDGKITVTLKYTAKELETDTIRSINSITINGKAVELKTNNEEEISFEIESLDVLQTRILANITYYNEFIPEFIAPGGMHTVELEILHNGELVKVENTEAETPDVTPEVPEAIANGTYEMTNDVFKTGTTTDSGVRGYIDTKSTIKVEDEKITVIMKYIDKEIILSTDYITIDGENVEFSVNEDGSISFEVESIDVLDTVIVVGITYDNPFFGPHSVKFDFLHKGDLVKAEDSTIENPGQNPPAPETPETPDDSESSEDDNSGNAGSGDVDGSTGATQKPSEGTGSESAGETETTVTYTGKNEIVSTSEAGKAMGRKAISEDMKIEKIGDKYRVTVRFTDFGAEQMSDIIVYVNGKEVESKSVKAASNGLSFEVGSLDDSIEISAKIEGMSGMRVSFGLNVLQDTLVEVDNEGTNGGTTDGTTGGTIGGTAGGTTSGTTEGSTTTEEETKITTGKLYSIQNNVTHENETGVAMARKYLSSTSRVEEIEGQYYVTLTFTGNEFMQNHEIYVNGVKASISKSTNGDETYVRFAVSSLSDAITVKAYVAPMSRDVEFGVQLLENTLTFIKEYTVETLPNTGAATSSAAVAGLGLLLTSAGAVLTKKRK